MLVRLGRESRKYSFPIYAEENTKPSSLSLTQKDTTVIVLLHTLQGAESRQVMRELDGRREAPTRWDGEGGWGVAV